MPFKDPEKRRAYNIAYQKEHYKNNKERYLAKQRLQKQSIAKWFNKLKSTLNCAECGYSFSKHPQVCDFHHIDSDDKCMSVSRLVGYSKNKVLEEIKKCVPLCANCHRIEHA